MHVQPWLFSVLIWTARAVGAVLVLDQVIDGRDVPDRVVAHDHAPDSMCQIATTQAASQSARTMPARPIAAFALMLGTPPVAPR